MIKFFNKYLLSFFLFFIFFLPTANADVGNFAIYRHLAGNDLENIQTWDQTLVEQDGFLLNNLNKYSISLLEGGHYLVMYNLALESRNGSGRSEIQSKLNLNSNDLSNGRSTGYIRRLDGANETWIFGSAIIEANQGDFLSIINQRTDTNILASVKYRENESSLMLLKLNDNWDYLRLKDSIGGQSFNSKNFSAINWDTDEELDINSFNRNGKDIILKNPGHYLISSNISFYNSTNNRRNNESRLTLDGSEIKGTRTSAYLRGRDNTKKHIATWIGIINTEKENQILNLEGACEGDSCGGVSNVGNETAIAIIKLPDNIDYFRLLDSSGEQKVNEKQYPIKFNTNLELNSSFSHSIDNNSSKIFIQKQSDYLFFANFYANRNNSVIGRLYPHWTWSKNENKINYGSFGKYLKGEQNNTGVFSAGNAGGIILPSLLPSDYIEIVNNNETKKIDNSAIFSSNKISMQGLNLANLFSNSSYIIQDSFRWRNNNYLLNDNNGWLTIENSNNIGSIEKNKIYRLRIGIINIGNKTQNKKHNYKLQWSDKTGFSDCSNLTNWQDLDSPENVFIMANTTNIEPNGQKIDSPFLNHKTSSVFVDGEGLDTSKQSSELPALQKNDYIELEYSLKAFLGAIIGHTYCFRVFDSTNNSSLNAYDFFPELNIQDSAFKKTIMEWGQKENVNDNNWSLIKFTHNYANPVFICSLNYKNNIGLENDNDADSVVCRVRNLKSNSVEIRLQEAGKILPSLNQSEDISWLVAEAGVYNFNDIKMEAFLSNSQITDRKKHWQGEMKNYQQNYLKPIILGQVMTFNDNKWSVFWSHGSSYQYPADSNNLYIGKHIGEDSDINRNDETLGVLIIETNHNNLNGIEYEANKTKRRIDRIDDKAPSIHSFNKNFSNTPKIALLSSAGIYGNDGSHPVAYGDNFLSNSSINLSVMEDEIKDGEQRGLSERISYLVFAEQGFYDITYSLDQVSYRFYENTDNIQPTNPIANENEIAKNISKGDILRLRIGIQAGLNFLPKNSLSFKLQYAEAQNNNCSQNLLWEDIKSTKAWTGYNNLNVNNGSQIVQSLLNNQNNSLEVYQEDNSVFLNPDSITNGKIGEWDWVIKNNNAKLSTQYCFRMVSSTNEIFQYSIYPKILTKNLEGKLNLNVPEFLNLNNVIFSFKEQTSANNTLERINIIDNRSNAPGWTLNVESADWITNNAIMDYDGDGINTGQLKIITDDILISANSGSLDGINIGPNDSFTENNKIINIITASPGFGKGNYNVDNLKLEQFIPQEQKIGNYKTILIFTIS